MRLWAAALLFAFVAAGILFVVMFFRHKAKTKRVIAGLFLLSAILVTLFVYILLTFVFLDARQNQPPDDSPASSAALESTPTTGDVASAETSTVPVFFPFEPYAVNGLNETQKELYGEIYPKIIAMEPFSYSAAERGYEALDDLLMAWGALMTDYPEIDNYFIIRENVDNEGTTLSLDSHYFCVWESEQSSGADELRAGLKLFYQECDSILADFPHTALAYDKYLYLAVEISKRVQYDHEFAHPGFATPYSIVTGYAICQGYAELYQYLCAKAGLWCRVVSGSSLNESHGWNLVKLESGTYHVDITWADEQPGEPGGGEWMNYFMLTQDQILADHEISDGTEATGTQINDRP